MCVRVCAHVYACVGHRMTSGAEGSLTGLELADATRLVGQQVTATLSISASRVLGDHMRTAVMASVWVLGIEFRSLYKPFTDLPITYIFMRFLGLLTIG